MASTYTVNSGIELIANGEQSGTWGDTTNVNLQIVDRLTGGVGTITLSGTTHTLTTTDGSLSDGQYKVLVLAGSPSGTNTITVTPNDQQKLYFVKNGSGQSAVFTQGSGGNVTIPNGESAIIYCDGAGAGAQVVNLSATFDLTTFLEAANNLSDVADVATARTNLAAAPLASPTFTGTATAPTVNASTALQIGGVAISATAAEINYLDITTLGTTEASKAVTADANGVVTFDNGISEEYTAVTSSSNATTVNLRDGTNFSHTLTENTTFTFSNPAASGKVSSFTLKIVQDASASGFVVTWPAAVDWPNATAPTLTATASAVDYFVFITHDGGTTFYGFTAGQAMG